MILFQHHDNDELAANFTYIQLFLLESKGPNSGNDQKPLYFGQGTNGLLTYAITDLLIIGIMTSVDEG